MGGTAQQSSLPQPPGQGSYPGQLIGSLPAVGGSGTGQFQKFSNYEPPPQIDPGFGIDLPRPVLGPDTPIYEMGGGVRGGPLDSPMQTAEGGRDPITGKPYEKAPPGTPYPTGFDPKTGYPISPTSPTSSTGEPISLNGSSGPAPTPQPSGPAQAAGAGAGDQGNPLQAALQTGQQTPQGTGGAPTGGAMPNSFQSRQQPQQQHPMWNFQALLQLLQRNQVQQAQQRQRMQRQMSQPPPPAQF